MKKYLGLSIVLLLAVFVNAHTIKAEDAAKSLPVISSFNTSTNATNVTAGQSITFMWSVANNPSVLIFKDTTSSNTITEVNVTGQSSFTFSPSNTNSYVLIAKNSFGTVTSDSITITVTAAAPTPSGDVTAPAAPTNLEAVPNSAFNLGLFNINIFWTEATDNVGVAGYKIYRNGTVLATIGADTAYSDTTVSPGTTYSYAVSAFDDAGNESLKSSTLTTKTASPSSVTTFPEIISFFHSSIKGINARLTRGNSTTLTWKVTGTPAPTISIDQGIGIVTGSSVTVSPTETTTYTLGAQNSVSGREAQLTVIVEEPGQTAIGSWQRVSKFAPVSRAGMSALVFKNKMWVMGGNGGNDIVWSEDGAVWNTARDNKPNDMNMWSPRYSQAGTVFKDKMWVMGGAGSSTGAGGGNDVWWSEDGIKWNLATARAAWSPRYTHSALTFKNKMWVMGGLHAGEFPGVWSSADGINWNLETKTPGWGAGSVFSSLVFKDKMWVIGGTVRSLDPIENPNTTKVWSSSDGIAWTKMTDDIGFVLSIGPFSSHGAVVFNNKIWVFGSHSETFSSSDGIIWQKENIESGWSDITHFASLAHQGTMWVLGGPSNNVWKFVPNNTFVTAFPKAATNNTSVAETIVPLASTISSATTTTTTECTITTTLRISSQGEQVKCLQSELGLGLTPDGKFGPKTRAAVVQFQIQNGLKADGIFGPLSRAKLGL